MATPLRVLIVEDSPDDMELVLLALERAGFDLTWSHVDSEPAYLAKLDANLDVILSDFSMPNFSGLRALELLRERGYDVPFIIISGTIGEDTAVMAMQMGAADYLIKDRPARLGPAVTQAMANCQQRREQNEAAATLRESEARLRVLFEQSAVGMCIISADGNFRHVNHRLSEIIGAAPDDLVSQSCFECIHPEDRAEAETIFQRVLFGESMPGRDVRFLRRDDSTIWCQLALSILPAETPKVSAVIVDINDRRKAESRFRRLVESNAQGIFFWNTQGRVTGANDAWLHLLGLSREEIGAGQVNWAALTPPEGAERDRQATRELQENGFLVPYEKEFIRKDGTRIPVLLGAAQFEDSPDEGLAFIIDLTEQKKLDQQLLRSQRMESIGTLAGGIAHDLNNVLGPIMMAIAVLKLRFPDSASLELINIIGSSAERGADMVRQVLSFARGVEGRRMEVAVKHLLQEVEKIALDTFSKNIQVRSIIPYDLWSVQGDPTQLHQVLLNLCVNARDAMPGGGALTISAENRVLDQQYAAFEEQAKPGPYVIMRIADTGTGMPAAMLEKIFDPFFTTKEVGKGTGLGLSTSAAIVKSHGGFLRVASDLGKGTTFSVHLPAQMTMAAEVTAEATPITPRGQGELILVVDDEAAVRQVTQHTLETFGYRVLVAANGAEATTIFAQRQAEIAVVFTDMMMPVMDGPATIQVLRKIKSTVRILAASGLAGKDQAAPLGVKRFLLKPYTAERLLQEIRELLDEK